LGTTRLLRRITVTNLAKTYSFGAKSAEKIISAVISLLNIYMETITISDLNSLKNIIDLACARGAFRASEAKEVGELYEKLTEFLEAVTAQAQAQSQSQGN
jgi:hypothetical protein